MMSSARILFLAPRATLALTKLCSRSSNVTRNSFKPLQTALLSHPSFSSDSSATPSPPPGSAEERIVSRLRASFPGCTDVAVVDVSGGCGAMYEVYVEAEEFRDVRMVKQHQMVTSALKEEIKDMHGLRISTQASPEKKED